MAADVVFTAEDPWYTSSQSWYGIVEFARSDPEPPFRQEHERYVSASPGIDFPSLPDDKPAAVAPVAFRRHRDNAGRGDLGR